MAKGFSIKIEGIPKAKAFMNKKVKLAIERADEGIKVGGLHLQGEVVESIAGHRAEHDSVDTGRFKNSIGVDFKKLQANISTNVSYAKFLEYGTSRFTARHHFRNTMERNKSKVVEFVQSKVNQI